MDSDKTITKNTYKSVKIQQGTTVKQTQMKTKSQIILPTQTIVIKHKNQSHRYLVYEDKNLGYSSAQVPMISLQVDEDCQTTQSHLRYGQKLCLRDLQNTMRYENAYLQSNYSSQYFDLNDSF